MSSDYYILPNENRGFEELSSLEEEFSTVDLSKDTIAVSGHPIITDGIRMLLNDKDTSTLVVAATRTGKTRRVLLPQMITTIKAGHSFICHDPKSELYKHTVSLLEKEGYLIKVLDLRDPRKGEGYNPVYLPAKLIKNGENPARGMEMLSHLGEALMKTVSSESDPLWHNGATMMFLGLMGLLIEIAPLEEVTIKNMVALLADGDRKDSKRISFLQKYFIMHPDSIYRDLLTFYMDAPYGTQGSFKAVLLSAVNKYIQNEEIFLFLNQSTFNVVDLIYKKMAIFIITREEGTIYNDIISTFIDQAYEIIIEEIEEKFNGKSPRKIEFLLDEFGNLAKINNIEAKITVCAARNIRFTLVCQSLKQLNYIYGPEIASIILGNCANLIYFYSNDLELLKYISELCGTYEDSEGRVRQLMSIEQLRSMEKKTGECLMLLDHQKPYVSHLPDISEYNLEILENTYSIKNRQPVVIKRFDFYHYVLNEINARQNPYNTTRTHHSKKSNEELIKERMEKYNPNKMKNMINTIIENEGQ